MAIRRIDKNAGVWAGYEGDVEPGRSSTGIVEGDIRKEIGTGAVYIYYDNAWQEDLTLVYAMKKAIQES